MMKKTTIGCAFLALLSLASPRALATNGTQLIGVGARAIARGGVDIGIADDATGIYTNPAGMGFVDGQRFDQLFLFIVPSIRASISGVTQSSDVTLPVVGASMAAVFDLEEPWHLADALTLSPDEENPTLPSRYDPAYQGSGLKFGFGVFPVAGNKIDLEMTTPFWDAVDVPATGFHLPAEPQSYKSDLQEVALTAALAWRVSSQLSIGFAPSFIYSKLKLREPTAAPISILAGHPLSNASTTYADLSPFLGIRQIEGLGDVSNAISYGFRGRVGAMFAPNDWLQIGLTYATRSFKQDYLGEGTLDFTRQIRRLGAQNFGVPGDELLKGFIEQNTGIPAADQTFKGRGNLRISSFDAPHEVGLGVSVSLPRLLIGLDVKWLHWSETMDTATIRITNNTSAELNELTGDQSTTQTYEIPLNWSDQVVLGVGVSFAAADWLTLRLGYNYGNNPIPENTVKPTAPAFLEHHVTGGFSIYYRRVELSGMVEWDLPASMTARNHLGNESLNGMKIDVSALFVGLAVGLRF